MWKQAQQEVRQHWFIVWLIAAYIQVLYQVVEYTQLVRWSPGMYSESWLHPWDRLTSWVYFTTCVQYLYISCYLSDNKPVLSYLLLFLLPQYDANVKLSEGDG